MAITVTAKQLEDARIEYEYFLKGTAGGFKTKLFHAIAHADQHNKYRLAIGFPGEVYAYMEYMEELEHHPYMFEIIS